MEKNIFRPLILLFAVLALVNTCFGQETLYPDSLFRTNEPSWYKRIVIKDNSTATQSTKAAVKWSAAKTSRNLGSEYSLVGELHHLIERQAEDTTGNNPTLLVVVNRFNLDLSPVQSFCWDVSFFYGDSNGYKMITRVQQYFEYLFKRKARMHLFEQTTRIIAHTFDSVMHIKNIKFEDTGVYDLGTAINYPDSVLKRFPIYRATTFKKGIYLSCENFLNHIPDDTEFIQVHHIDDNLNRPHFYYKEANGKKGDRIKNFFAVYDGYNWYLNRKGTGNRMLCKNGNFYADRYLRGIAPKSNAVIMPYDVGVLGIGLSIVAAVAIYEFESDVSEQQTITYRTILNPVDRKFHPIKRLE